MATLSPSLKQLAKEVAPGFPRKDTSDGWIGDSQHSTRTSDHNPDPRGIVHAIDIDIDGNNYTPEEILETALADPRCKYCIYQAKLYYPDGTIRDNSGHFQHIHISGKYGELYENDTSPWFKQETDMTPALAAKPGADRLDAFVIGKNKSVWWKRSEGATWSGWEDIGGQALSGVAAEWRGNSLVVAVKGTDGALWHNYSSDGITWAGWGSLGGEIA